MGGEGWANREGKRQREDKKGGQGALGGVVECGDRVSLPKGRSGGPHCRLMLPPYNSPSHALPISSSSENIQYLLCGKVRPNILEFECHKSAFTIHWPNFAKLWKIRNHSVREKKLFFFSFSPQNINYQF